MNKNLKQKYAENVLMFLLLIYLAVVVENVTWENIDKVKLR